MNILVILGHPRSDSLGSTFGRAYAQQARVAGHTVREVDLGTLAFDPVLHGGFKGDQPLEPALQKATEDLQWANHLVFAFPVWWGGMPAVLKGFIDRTFLPGVAFKCRKDSPLQDKRFTGKTARLLVTADSPRWWVVLMTGDTAVKTLRDPILAFCGVKPTKTSYFAPVRGSSDQQRAAWLAEAGKLGSQGA